MNGGLLCESRFSADVGVISGRRQFIGVLTEALALCLDESLDELVAQIAVADGYGTCLTEQGRVAVALETEEALGSAEVYLFGLSSGEYGLYYCLELGADAFGFGYEVLGAVCAVFP